MSASRDLKMDWSDGAAWNSRGIGSEFGLPCFVTGAPSTGARDLKPNIAAFVESREAGTVIVAGMFKGLARLDYRAHEPHWIQVKVGVVEEHKAALEELERLTKANKDKITSEIIQKAREFSLSRQAAPAPTR